MRKPIYLRPFAAPLLMLLIASTTAAQEQSVRPGINKGYESGPVDKFIKNFEREGRDVFDCREQVLAAVGIEPGMDVADVGAGTGLFLGPFSKAVGGNGTLYAVDITEKFIDHLRNKAAELKLTNVTPVLCTAESTKLPPDSVDLVFICDTYHHFEFPIKTMRSVHQALRSGGRLIVIDFERIEGESPQWILNHVRAGEDVVTEEITSAGFELVSEQDILRENYFLQFRKVDVSQ